MTAHKVDLMQPRKHAGELDNELVKVNSFTVDQEIRLKPLIKLL